MNLANIPTEMNEHSDVIKVSKRKGDFFLQRELGRAALGIASCANYEQCLVPLEKCCFYAALLYGIISRHANTPRHFQITMRFLLNLNLLW